MCILRRDKHDMCGHFHLTFEACSKVTKKYGSCTAISHVTTIHQDTLCLECIHTKDLNDSQIAQAETAINLRNQLTSLVTHLNATKPRAITDLEDNAKKANHNMPIKMTDAEMMSKLGLASTFVEGFQKLEKDLQGIQQYYWGLGKAQNFTLEVRMREASTQGYGDRNEKLIEEAKEGFDEQGALAIKAIEATVEAAKKTIVMKCEERMKDLME